MLSAAGLGFRRNPNSNWLFRNLSFILPSGEILALLGPNGRGKTTLLKCLAGLHAPSEGHVTRTGAIGYVPQHFVTPFDYSVRDIVLMGRARHIGVFSNPTSEDRAIADEALAMLGLPAFAERIFTTLSGGERQMVLMARALASGAEIMLLDEPTSALDFRNQALLLLTLKKVASERGLTVVITTQDPTEALEIADRALLLQGGDGYDEGRAADILVPDKLSRLYNVTMRTMQSGDGGTAIVPDFGSVLPVSH